jgi:hypothetical protein
MGGQTGSQQQQTQQTTQLPPWINEAAQQNYAFAQNVANRPLQQYQGQLVPDVSDQLQQAWNTAATAGNAGMPQYNAATAGFTGALGQTPTSVTDPGNANAITAGQLSNTNLQPYMNPFTQSVINSSLPIMQQQLGQTLAQNAGTAAQTGAFGGSRFGVQQGVAQAQGALGMANMAAGLNQANFNQAQTAATGDINRQLQAATTNQASQQTDLARNLQAQQLNQAAQQAKINSDIAASQGLNTAGQGVANQANTAYQEQKEAGATQMAQAQNQINAQMQKFQQAWGYPTQQMGILQSALGMTPYGQTTTGQSNTQTYTPMDWGALAGKGLGLATSLIPGPSDRRLKKNLKRVGTHQPTGVPVYQFNWKGQPPGAPKTQGPMAQDVEKVLPGAVADHPITGVKHVHPVVLGALSQPAPRGLRGAAASPLTPMSRTQHRRRIRPPQLRGSLGA